MDKAQCHTSSLFNTMQLLKAYEQAIDENIISSITDTKGIIVHANRQFCEISQYSLNEILGQSHLLINSQFHSKAFFKDMWKTIGGGKVWRDDIRNRAKNGTYYWVDTVIVPIKDDERITHYLSLRTLITERKNLESKKQTYVSSLEVLLVMTASKIKKPLSDCVELLKNLDGADVPDKTELIGILSTLQLSVSELNTFTNELSKFIREIEY